MLMLKKDFLISVPAFWLCSILGFSLPYRVFFQCKTGVMVLPSAPCTPVAEDYGHGPTPRGVTWSSPMDP